MKLQAKDLLISQQTALLTNLPSSFCHEIQITGLHDEAYINTLDKHYNSVYGSYSVTHNNVNLYLQDQGIAVQESLCSLEYEGSHSVINIIGIYMVQIVDGLFKIHAERNSANSATDSYTIPLVLPIQNMPCSIF